MVNMPCQRRPPGTEEWVVAGRDRPHSHALVERQRECAGVRSLGETCSPAPGVRRVSGPPPCDSQVGKPRSVPFTAARTSPSSGASSATQMLHPSPTRKCWHTSSVAHQQCD